jgi:Mrp family chromosome partitioning ATPase
MASRLQGIASSVEQQAFRNTANSVELGELVRAADIAEQAYRDISTRVEEMRAQMQFEGVSSSIVSPAVPDFSPVAPAPLKMTLIALVGSGILAFMLALVRDVTDDRLRTSAQIRRHFGLPTYGQLPLLPNFKSTVDPNESPVLNDPQSLFAEVARGAYCDVRALRETSGAQTVLVTSPLPGDGKSTVSLTLAAAGLAMGDKTLVIDLDLRKSGLIQLLREDQRGPDLIDLVTHRVGVDQLIAPPAQIEGGDSESSDFGEYPHLRILSAHKPVDEPARLLTSARLTQLMAELRNHYDFIVINAPAALAVRDARGMSQFADHTVMVARWGHTTVEQMTAALELLNYDASGVIFDHVDYAEHARHRYGDSVQFYVDSSDYYSDDFRHPPTVGERFREIGARLRNLFPSKHGAA